MKDRKKKFPNRFQRLKYYKCRAYLNFEFDFRFICAIGAVLTWWNLILFRK